MKKTSKQSRPIRSTKPRRRSQSRTSTSTAHEQTAFGLPSDMLERAIITGESRGLLEDYFGPESYSELQDLARDASTRSLRGGPRVFILPGIMGSTLSKPGPLHTRRTLWLNPVEIAFGRATDLKLDGSQTEYAASGVILLAYLKLKLRLRIAGFNADFFPYDWRFSLADAGSKLADAIQKEGAAQVSLVAHSMGGLVARAALKSANAKISRIIMLGTPNYGSFAPAQVIRGTYDVVQKIARLDQRHTAEQLAGQVFNTFPGLYELLPAADKFPAVDLYNAASWPASGPQPRADLLSTVKRVFSNLAAADDRFFLIAGINQDTVTGLRMAGNEFAYEISAEGDGTVPLEFALLAGLAEKHTYYVEEGHGGLPNNSSVESAVVDLLSKGTTTALPTERPALKRASRVVPESEVRAMAQNAPGIGQLGSVDYRRLLEAVAAPPDAKRTQEGSSPSLSGTGGGSVTANLSAPLQGLTIGRRRQRRIEITLAHGSITDVDARAYVLGVFRNVAPSGAAKAIDQRLNGAISEFTARRMFSGDVGSVFTVPAGRNQLGAEMVLFAGLGSFDNFNSDVQQLVAENTIRLLVRSRIDEFATILIGAGTGQGTATILQNLLTGFFRGLKDADTHHHFRSITLCETDPTRFAELRNELYRIGATSLFEDVELTLDEMEVPVPLQQSPRVLAPGQEPIYVMVRQEGVSATQLHYRVSLLGAGNKAAVVSAGREIDKRQLTTLLDRFDQAFGPGGNVKDPKPFGKEFADLVLPAEVCAVLGSMRDRHLVIVHDAGASRIPWETLTIGSAKGKNQSDWSPALEAGMSRRYLADHLPLATWMEERRANPVLRLLLIVNPLGDLAGAEKEGDRISDLAHSIADIEITTLRQQKASKSAVLSILRSGKYDCIHYAGHAFFDPQRPGQSGLMCAGREVLSGSDLVGISNLPSLVFFNACEAGRVRGVPQKSVKAASLQAEDSYGVAEALMRGGIANYLSTYWPVGDTAAEMFSTGFYKSLMAGQPLGPALLDCRKALSAAAEKDWADYILYGNFEFVLKQNPRHQ